MGRNTVVCFMRKAKMKMANRIKSKELRIKFRVKNLVAAISSLFYKYL